MTNIVNGAPQIILLGTKDVSTREPLRSVQSRPTHLPLSYFYARRGPAGARLIGDGDQTQYHIDTFDPRKKYYNHATVFLAGFLGEGNAVMAERLIPDDAAPEAAVRVSLEVLETEVDIYERNVDGTIKYVTGNPVVSGTPVPGFKARFVIGPVPTGLTGFGSGAVAPGTLSDGTWAVSEVIPLFDVKESSIGEDGNLTAINFFAPTRETTEAQFDTRLLSSLRAYPFAFRVGRKASVTSSPTAVEDITGTKTSIYTFLQNAINPYTDAQMHFADVVVGKYNRHNDSRMPDVDGFLGNVAVYQTNINALLARLYAAEKTYADANPLITTNYDFLFDGQAEDHLFNFMGGSTYDGYPYHTYQLEAAVDGFQATSSQWASFQGGADGTMNDAAFATLVEAKMADYASRFSAVHDDARRVESVFYDSGFPLATKYKLLDLLAIRKDVALGLSVYEAGAPKGTAADNYATASALRARAMLYPESTYFGTPCSRVIIMGRSGQLIGSPYKNRVPGLYEVAMKSAAYMGAGNRVWKEDKKPAGYPNSIIKYLTDIDVDYTPVDQRVLDWDVGLNWIQNYDLNSQHIPAYKTVYNNDTSVLNSWFTVLGIVEINKVCQQVHRRFSGVDYLTNAQLAERVDRAIANELSGVFGSRFKIEVETTFTDSDIANNNSWTTVVRLGAAGVKTVMTAYVEAHRIEDMV